MKYLLFLISIVFVMLGVLGTIFNLSLNYNQALSFFIIGNFSLGFYYMKKEDRSTKWWIFFFVGCGIFTTIWFAGFFQNVHF